MVNLKKKLKIVFDYLTKHKNITLLSLILILSLLFFSQYLKHVFISIIFILIAGISKVYQRFLKNTLGLNLILFPTLMIGLVYKNTILALSVGWISLILADYVAIKLSHTSLVSLFGITLIVFLSKLFYTFPIIFSLIELK